MHDVIAVMDAVGSERAVLFGYSEGGPMAVLMAAMRPERVAGLVLYASYARRTWAADHPWAPTMAERDAFTERLVTGWDWEEDLRIRSPSADEAMMRWWTLRMRAAATPSTVRALMDMNNLIDVRDVLPSIRVPTLVVHRRDDQLVRLAESEYLADRIAGARLVVQEGIDHFMAYGADEVLDVIEPFVEEIAAAPAPTEDPPLVLAAVVALAGPATEVERVVAALVGRGGRRRTAGPRTVLLFDGPATAVRAVRQVELGTPGLGRSAWAWRSPRSPGRVLSKDLASTPRDGWPTARARRAGRLGAGPHPARRVDRGRAVGGDL